MRAALFVIGAVAIFTVFSTVYALFDDSNRIRLLPRWVWVLLCVVTTPIGGILYFVYGRARTGEVRGR